MAKEHVGRTKATATKTLYAVMKEISRRGCSMPAKELYPFVEANEKLTEWELEPAGKNKYIRWTNSFQFYSINYAKAGLIVKQKGMWYLTPEGEAALKLSPEEVMEKGEVAYREWRKLNPREDKRDEEPTDENAERDRAEELNLLESDAREGIRHFIVSKSPYEFQDMVAALLRAMGYHTPFIAPKGKDGGIDIIAYLDPLGAQTPRIKVQVKHKPDTAIGASEVRALSGILKAGDIALFVTSGTYSADARNAASGNDKFIRLIDGNDFIDMWQEYYDKMTDDDKNMLPLKRIAFLGNNE